MNYFKHYQFLLQILLIIICTGIVPNTVLAHDSDTISYTKIEVVDNQARFVNLNRTLNTDGDISNSSHLFYAGYPDFREEIIQTVLVYNNGTICPLTNFLTHSDNALSDDTYFFIAQCSNTIDELTIKDSFPLDNQTILVYTISQNEHSLVHTQKSPAVFSVKILDTGIVNNTIDTSNTIKKQYSQSTANNILNLFSSYVMIGFTHILSGIDHIFFILGFILLSQTFIGLLKGVTGFTISHSITLILATLSIFSISSSIIEPLIALSIAIVGILTVLDIAKNWLTHFGIIFIFGLFHGLGFATSISDVGFPKEGFGPALLGFNIGIEIGQLLIVSLVFPLLCTLKKHYPTNHRIIISNMASVITIGGIFWFIQRMFF